MANILGVQTVDGSLVISVDGDPAAGAGTPSPLGSLALVNDGSGMWFKTGAADTGWQKVVLL